MVETKVIYHNTFEITKSNSITIQVGYYMGKNLLNIYKSSFSDRYTGIVKNNTIAFGFEQIQELQDIIGSVSGVNEIQEYGTIGKYKLYTSTYKGNNSFQIREWFKTSSYEGFGKKGISIPMSKFEVFRETLNNVIEYFYKYNNGDVVLEQKQIPNDGDIESYF